MNEQSEVIRNAHYATPCCCPEHEGPLLASYECPIHGLLAHNIEELIHERVTQINLRQATISGWMGRLKQSQQATLRAGGTVPFKFEALKPQCTECDSKLPPGYAPYGI